MNPRYPIYIPSRRRAESRLTVKALERMGVPYRVVIEEDDYEDYAKVIDPAHILVLDPQYQHDYEKCDDLGMTKPAGAGAVRNFIWDHSLAEGHERHWTMDDNIRQFSRFQNNLIIRLDSGVGFRAMEDFVDRYDNVAMAGPQYEMFVPRKTLVPPFVANTRIYSCNLIKNNIPFRWRGRYNEDTILSLDILKAGWCTIQFNAFLQLKMTTQLMSGGNTDVLYKDGTTEKSAMLVREHPDVSKMVMRFGRVHHHCNYNVFKSNRLIKKKDCVVPQGTNEYGMKLKKVHKC